MFYLGMFQPNGVQPESRALVSQIARLAGQMGARAFFTIGIHGAPLSRMDIDCLDLRDIHEARNYLPAYPWVAIETDLAEPLAEFTHPADAIYLLGPPNGTIPRKLLMDMAAVVKVESVKGTPLYVPVAAGVVLHDRLVKLSHAGLQL